MCNPASHHVLPCAAQGLCQQEGHQQTQPLTLDQTVGQNQTFFFITQPVCGGALWTVRTN